MRTQMARRLHELMHHLDLVLQTVFLDGLEHEHLMLVHGARARAAGKRRNARQQRILAALLGPPRRAQPRPSRGHRP